MDLAPILVAFSRLLCGVRKQAGGWADIKQAGRTAMLVRRSARCDGERAGSLARTTRAGWAREQRGPGRGAVETGMPDGGGRTTRKSARS